jgi:putative tricarboxylic transport membrane protein
MQAQTETMLAGFLHRALLGTALALGLGIAPAAQAQIKGLEIIAPANPGGGWDQTARAMQASLQEAGLASGVQVQNIAGAGGTIGLAQFVTSKKRDGHALLVGGLVMLGAIVTNKSPVSMEDVAPVARLTGEYELIVVSVDSPIRTMADLVAKLKIDPGAVSWGGGSAAHSGGGEALASILGGHVTVGISGYEEFAPQIVAGKLRGIAISADQRPPGIDMPTLKEQGIDVSLVNWRGVMAGSQLRDADRKALAAAIDGMVKSPSWQETLKKRGWIDMYQPADEFAAFLKQDRATVETTLKDIGLVK